MRRGGEKGGCGSDGKGAKQCAARFLEHKFESSEEGWRLRLE